MHFINQEAPAAPRRARGRWFAGFVAVSVGLAGGSLSAPATAVTPLAADAGACRPPGQRCIDARAGLASAQAALLIAAENYAKCSRMHSCVSGRDGELAILQEAQKKVAHWNDVVDRDCRGQCP